MDRTALVLFSAIGFTFGCLILVFGAVLHSTYSYGAVYPNALHVPIRAGLIMIIGGIVAILGLVGMLRAMLAR